MMSPRPSFKRTQAVYQEQPYSHHAHLFSHPSQLATTAKLWGLDSPDVSECRVLELGCASGGNLIPMAYELPQAEFVGIDLSPSQIERGQQLIAEVGLKNIQLQSHNLLEIEDQLGTFDYIIAHGVYSWVPDVVKEKVLQLSKKLLNPKGLAYVSYNVFPGGRLRDILRKLCLFHVGEYDTASELLEKSRSFLRLMTDSFDTSISSYHQLMKEEAEIRLNASDDMIIHDTLSEYNDPVYFHQFVDHAAQHQLQYVGETLSLGVEYLGNAAWTWKDVGNLRVPKEELKHLYETRSWTDCYQLLDFAYGRYFHRSILCHADRKLERNILPERIQEFQISSLIKSIDQDGSKKKISQVKLKEGELEYFLTDEDRPVQIQDAQLKSFLIVLQQQDPNSISIQDLHQQANGLLMAAGEETKTLDSAEMKRIGEKLFSCYGEKILSLHSSPTNISTEISDYPMASATARNEATFQGHVTNLCHRVVQLEELAHMMIPYMDGKHSHTEIAQKVFDELQAKKSPGSFSESRTNLKAKLAKSQSLEPIEELVKERLKMFAETGLLVG